MTGEDVGSRKKKDGIHRRQLILIRIVFSQHTMAKKEEKVFVRLIQTCLIRCTRQVDSFRC